MNLSAPTPTTLLLPPSGDAPEAPRPGKKPNGHTHDAKGEKRVVLLVDDSEQDQALIGAAMGDIGIDGALRWAKSHDEAVNYFLGKPPFDDRFKNPIPALVLLDISMPSKDGFSVLSWLRSRTADFHRVPVVMLTTSSRREEVVRAYELGANSYLVKPTGYAELCETLKATTDYWLKQNRFG